MDEKYQRLICAARDAAEHAYCPYSTFKVGAAILTAEGKTFTGCNVENASYGLSLCAERNAISAAVADGSRSFLALAVAAPRGAASPCGACRQFLLEFGSDIDVIFPCPDGSYTVRKSGELLPDPFILTEDR